MAIVETEYIVDGTSGENFKARLFLGEIQSFAEADETCDDYLYRLGYIKTENGGKANITAVHTPETLKLIYQSKERLDAREIHRLNLEGIIQPGEQVPILGFMITSVPRINLLAGGVRGVVRTPLFKQELEALSDPEKKEVIVPILGEGPFYRSAEAIYDEYGLKQSIVHVGAGHKRDTTISGYERTTAIPYVRDNDFNDERKKQIESFDIEDSGASGTVIIDTTDHLIKERGFSNVKQIRWISPLATRRSIARAAYYHPNIDWSVYCFETVLNTVPPDHYWSPISPNPLWHIVPELARKKMIIMGVDPEKRWIVEDACTGMNWTAAETDFRKQLEEANKQLYNFHGVTIPDIYRARNWEHELYTQGTWDEVKKNPQYFMVLPREPAYIRV